MHVGACSVTYNVGGFILCSVSLSPSFCYVPLNSTCTSVLSSKRSLGNTAGAIGRISATANRQINEAGCPLCISAVRFLEGIKRTDEHLLVANSLVVLWFAVGSLLLLMMLLDVVVVVVVDVADRTRPPTIRMRSKSGDYPRVCCALCKVNQWRTRRSYLDLLEAERNDGCVEHSHMHCYSTV